MLLLVMLFFNSGFGHTVIFFSTLVPSMAHTADQPSMQDVCSQLSKQEWQESDCFIGGNQ